jgi:type IV secretion system protein VirD4
MLGEQEVLSESFGMGQSAGDAPSLSIGRARAPLLTPEQIRRLREDEQIIFVKNLPPIRALKVGYQEVQPWRDQVAPNPLHGGKAFLGKVKMRLVHGHAKATRAGRAKRERQPRPFLLPILAALTPLSPGMPVLSLAGAFLIVATYGLPHLLVEYTHSGSWCRYIGLPVVTQPFETHGNGQCKLIVWKHAGSTVR